VIGQNVKRALLEQVEPHSGPVLSLYLDVNPATPDNSQKAFVLRAAEAMRAIDLDPEYIEQVTEKLAREFVIGQGRSLAIFAGEDLDELFNSYYMQTRLPFLGLSDGALARWGRPFLAPLLYALDSKERYAVIYISSDHVRLFETFLGQIEEVADYVRPLDTGDWQQYRNARRSPAVGVGVAARGGAAVDAFKDRVEEASARLYRSLMPEVEALVKAEQIDGVILSGVPGAITAFRDAMNSGMLQRVVGSVSPPANPDGPARDWLPLIADVVTKAEEQRELALLDRVRETGVWSLSETLKLLQERRLDTLVLPFVLEQRVHMAASGTVSASAVEAREASPGEAVEEVSLLEVVPALVERTGTKIEFVEGEAERRLVEEFGAIAGIKRW